MWHISEQCLITIVTKCIARIHVGRVHNYKYTYAYICIQTYTYSHTYTHTHAFTYIPHISIRNTKYICEHSLSKDITRIIHDKQLIS